MHYIFYDTETTGLSNAFDQILQFAAIVTDESFTVVEEINLRGRLRPFVLPSPGAMAVTGIGPQAIKSAPLSHYELICAIRSVIERYTPSYLIGYNSIGFDEGMLRSAFYQTLHPTYLTQLNGNARLDVMRLAHAVAEHEPDALNVPLNDAGKPSFKLGPLAEANGIPLNNAHDALADTRATLSLATLLKAKAPSVWDMLIAARNKRSVQSLIKDFPIMVTTDQRYGSKTIVGVPFAINPENDAEVAVFDLHHNPSDYLDIDEDGVRRLLSGTPRVVRTLRMNQLPILRVATVSDFQGVSGAEMEARRTTLLSADAVRLGVAQGMSAKYADAPPAEHIEQQIFDGFPSRKDQRTFETFHQADWSGKAQLTEAFDDPKYGEFARRIMLENAPELLPTDVRKQLENEANERMWREDEPPWTTVTQARQELEKKIRNGENSLELLDEMSIWLDTFENPTSRKS